MRDGRSRSTDDLSSATGWHVTGEDEVAGVAPSPESSPGCRPTISHDLDPKICTHCNKAPKRGSSTWCSDCIQSARDASRVSMMRQVQAGMPSPPRNWKPGDPFWWKASGCYGKT